MSDPDQPQAPPAIRRSLLAILLAALALLCIVVLRPFIAPVAWAAILAYTGWPAYQHIARLCRRRPTPAALLMTTVIALILIVPLLLLTVFLRIEIAGAYEALLAYRADGAPLPSFLGSIPWFGDALQQALDRYLGDPLLIRKLIIDWARNSHDELLDVVGTVSRNVAKLLVAIITVFFFFRDGARLLGEAGRILNRLFDDRLDRYLRAAGVTVHAVVFGFLITALVQGTIAGIGYAVVGVDAPVLLGALTTLASIVPVIGTGLVWGAVALALLVTGHLWPGLGLIAWGALLVHPVDNLVRPLLISNATQMPFLLVMFGVLGGIGAFGLVGMFIGPVALAVATSVWREWLDERHDAQAPPAGGSTHRAEP